MLSLVILQVLPEDYTNRVITDMLLEMIKEGNHVEVRAWTLFHQLRKRKRVKLDYFIAPSFATVRLATHLFLFYINPWISARRSAGI